MPENYLQPVAKLTDPKHLRTKQFMRKMNADSLILMAWIFSIIAPIVFSFLYKNPVHLLQIAYLPLSFFIGPIIYNPIVPPTAIFGIILIALIGLINHLAPDPNWFILIVPAQIWIFWYATRHLPSLHSREWNEFIQNTGMTEEEIKKALAD